VHFGVKLDLMATAKAITAGLSLGAIIGRADIIPLSRGSHANTFGGNPVAAAAALATLKMIEEDLLRHAVSLGDELKKCLKKSWGRATT